MYAPAIPTNVDLNRPVRSKFQLPPPALGSISSKNDTRKDRTTTTTRYLRKKDGSKDVYETTEDKPAPTATASAPAAFLRVPAKTSSKTAPTSIKGTQLQEGYFKKGGKTKKRRRKKRKKRKTKKKRRRKKKTHKKRGRRKIRTRRR